MKKICVVLLVLTIMLGSVSIFWSKPAQANTGAERRVMLCAEPWHGGEWNKVTPPPSSDQNPVNSSTNSVRPEDKPELPRFQQKPQKSFKGVVS
jgi:hypothetical protein